MRERFSSTKPIFCSGCSQPAYVVYDEGGKIFCFSCAFTYGAIDIDQWRGDSSEDYLLKAIKNKESGV